MSATQSCRAYPLSLVTTRWRHKEVNPGELGLSRSIVSSIWRGLESIYKTRAHPALSFSLRRHGQIVIQGSIGHKLGNAPGDALDSPKELVTPNSLFNLFSAAKPMTAMVIHQLNELGTLNIDDRVAKYIPEFTGYSKETMTIRNILHHRSGLPSIAAEELFTLVGQREALISKLSGLKLTRKPGFKLGYEALLGGFLLGEIVERSTGQTLRAWFQEHVADPLGMDHLCFGLKPNDIDQVVPNVFTGPKVPWPFTSSFQKAFGIDLEQAIELSNTPRFLTSIVPWGNVIGTADEACQFFQVLLDEGRYQGQQIFHPRAVRGALIEQSYLERDLTLGYPMRYSMGFMLGSQYLSFFGQETKKLFGHLGLMNIFVFADPERDISVCLMANGKPFIYPGVVQWLRFLRSISHLIPRTGQRSR